MASFSILVLISGVYSTTGLNVVLSSQTPDPVAPGNFVYANVKVSNVGSDAISRTKVRFIENDVFKLADGEDLEKVVGAIPAFSTDTDSSGFIIAKYKLLVNEGSPLGENTAEFEVEVGNEIYTYELDILVQDSNPRILIDNFNVEKVEPGSSVEMSFDVMNVNSIALKDVFVTLELDSVTDTVLSVESGSNQKIIPNIGPGEKDSLSFSIKSSPGADSRPYLLPINITYEDSIGNTFTKEILGSVEVYANPIVALELDSQTNLGTGVGKYTFAIANPGTGSIKGTRVEILPGENYRVIDGDFQYIGDLNPDDFQTLQTELLVDAVQDTNVNLKLSYLDSYNNEVDKSMSIPIKVYSEEDLAKIGVTAQSSSGSSVVTIVLVILVIVAYFIGRKFGYRKGKLKK